MIGLGTQELIVLGILAAAAVGAAVFIVLVVVRSVSPSPAIGDRMAALERENRRLREDVDRLKGGPENPPPMG